MTTGTKPADKGKVHEPEFSKVPPALTHDLSITDGAVRLYAHMYWMFWKHGSDNEGQTSMAVSMGVSEVTIVKRIEELEYHGWIVVVEQGRDKQSGNYLTPFYHVFVEQKDAVEFRKDYKCDPNETIRPKPAQVREKKSRKGKGGKPSNITKYNEDKNRTNSGSYSHTNSSWDGGTNSSKDGGTNLSWEELDSNALDSGLDSNTNTPHTPAPIGLGSAATPPSDPTGLQAFYDKLTGSEIPEPKPVEEIPTQPANVPTPPNPSSAAPPSPSESEEFDMKHLRDVVANKWFEFNKPKQLLSKSNQKTVKRFNPIIDTIVETFPDATDDRHAWVALQFCADWGTKKDKDGKKLSMPLDVSKFGIHWRKWLNEHPEIAKQISPLSPAVTDAQIYSPESRAALAAYQNQRLQAQLGNKAAEVKSPFTTFKAAEAGGTK